MAERENDKLLKLEQVKEQLNVSIATVYRLVYSGAIQTVKVGRQHRVEPAELERYKRERTVKTTVEAKA